MGHCACSQPYEYPDMREARKTNTTDIMSFDNVPAALPIILHMVTLASWQEIMHITQQTSGTYTGIYFIISILLGAYFVMNIFVAILHEKFGASEAVEYGALNAFELIDTDHGGTLSIDEVRKVFLSHGIFIDDDLLAQTFAQMDAHDDGFVTLTEFKKWLAGNSTMAAKLRKNLAVVVYGGAGENTDIDPLDSAKRTLTDMATTKDGVDWGLMFDYYDVDGNGKMSLKEMRTAFRRDAHITPDVMSDNQIAAVFANIDANGEGMVSLDEFEQWISPDGPPPEVDEVIFQAVINMIVKASCKTLDITPLKGKFDNEQVEEALDESAEAVRAFALGEKKRKLFVIYQPKLEDRDGKLSRVGPSLVTVSSSIVKPFVGFAVKFKCQTMLEKTVVTGKKKKRRFKPNAVWGKIVYSEYVNLSGCRLQIRKRIVQTSWFKYLFAWLVMANIATLCMDHHGIKPKAEQQLDTISHVFTMLFLVETCLKLLGLTRREFWRDGFTVFEFMIVITGVVELFAMLINAADMGFGGTKTFRFFKVARALRVLRVLRVIAFFKSLRTVVDVILACLWDLVYVLLMISMALYIFTLLGMQSFGGQITDLDGSVPRGNWDSFEIALFTTFQIMTLDGWNVIMYDVTRLWGPLAISYFVVWIMLGTWVLSNLLLVTIMDAYVVTAEKMRIRDAALAAETNWMDERHSDKNDKKKKEQKKQNKNKNKNKNKKNGRRVTTLQDNQPLSLQVRCQLLADHRGFDVFFLCIVVANCITVGLDKPWLEDDDPYRRLFVSTAPVFVLLFSFEAAVKIIAWGFIDGPDAYLNSQNPNYLWNRLDFVILLSSILDPLAQAMSIRGGDGRTFLFLRPFRALRLLSKLRGLQVLVQSIMRSITALFNIIVVTVLSWMVFGLTSVTYLKGTLYQCSDSDAGIEGKLTCIGSFVEQQGRDFGIAPRSWFAAYSAYDRIDMAMYTLFEMSGGEWVDSARLAMDHTAVDKQPEVNANSMWSFFFMAFFIVNNFFLINLFIGVIYSKYVQAKNAGLEDLTDIQHDWFTVMQALINVRPRKFHRVSRLDRLLAFEIATASWFENVMMGVIMFNVGVMALKYDGEPQAWTDTQNYLNDICTLVYTGEACLKLWAFGLHGYFNENWNRFDFFVVLASWFDYLARLYELDKEVSPTPGRLIRIIRVVGRIGRMFKARKRLASIKMIFDTFTDALPAMFYVVLLLIVVVYIFGVLAMNLFGRVAHQQCINEHTNFETTPRAMATLFGMATGDGTKCIVHECMVQEFGKSYARAGACSEAKGTCGEPRNARLFFLTFKLFIVFTSMELFVNVVLDRFQLLAEMKAQRITRDDFDAFCDIWKQFDIDAEGEVPVQQIPKLLKQLEKHVPALGRDKQIGEEAIVLHELRLPERPGGKHSRFLVTGSKKQAEEDLLCRLTGDDDAQGTYTYVDPDLPLTAAPADATVNFLELLYGLTERKCGCPMPRDNPTVDEVRRLLAEQMPTVAHLFESSSHLTTTAAKRAAETAMMDGETETHLRVANPLMDAMEEK